MKRMHGSARTLGLCVLMAILLAGPAIAKTDAVLDWNEIAVNTAIGQNPLAQARYAAIVQLAVFEAVNAVRGDYRPYLGGIFAPRGSADAAAIQAAYRVLSTYFPASSALLDDARRKSLALIPDGEAKIKGIATGDAAAYAMIALRANDGSSPAQFKIPGPPVPGEWQATPSCPIVNGVAVGIAFQWQNITPFGIPSVHEFLLDPPPALSSWGLRENVQRGDDGRGCRQHRAPTGSVRCCDLLRGLIANLRLQSRREAGREGTMDVTLRERQGAGPHQHGDQR